MSLLELGIEGFLNKGLKSKTMVFITVDGLDTLKVKLDHENEREVVKSYKCLGVILRERKNVN